MQGARVSAIRVDARGGTQSAREARSGIRVDARAIPLVDDGATHRVRVVMGEPEPHASPIPAAETTLSLRIPPEQ